MAWVSVHQDVDGGKLRKLYQAIGCSKFEALGILNFLWFWGLKNADETGLVEDADLSVLSRYLYGCGEGSDLDMNLVAQALVNTGWVDLVPNGFILHDWDVWQEQWYKLQRTRKYDAERKRKARQMDSDKKDPQKVEQQISLLPEETEVAEAKRVKPKKKTPEKHKYAEFVWMTESSYNKLLEQYGKAFADACITELDLYKGAKGKTYKDDYRAILSWVVDRVNQRKPGLLSQSKAVGSLTSIDNPFKEFDESI